MKINSCTCTVTRLGVYRKKCLFDRGTIWPVISLFESQGHPLAPSLGRFSYILQEVSANQLKRQIGLLGRQAWFCLYLCLRLNYNTQAMHDTLLL
uniref:Uncharacterized protein n=1 Tax=Arundo donax TaxID=35708 RepID=A0A0A9FAT0_ARUDO